jgi:hypothetical protein
LGDAADDNGRNHTIPLKPGNQMADFFRLGLASSSPPQLGQRFCMAELQSAQNVHS